MHLFTDHKSITEVRIELLVQWATLFREYDLVVHHLPGSMNVLADTLSRASHLSGPLPPPRQLLAAEGAEELAAASIIPYTNSNFIDGSPDSCLPPVDGLTIAEHVDAYRVPPTTWSAHSHRTLLRHRRPTYLTVSRPHRLLVARHLRQPAESSELCVGHFDRAPPAPRSDSEATAIMEWVHRRFIVQMDA